MIESRASIAPTSPPDTGASSVWKGGWFFSARSANSLVRCGEIVLMSTASSPSWAPAATPSAPNSTASTSGESTTIVTTMSERCATSRGVRATAMPSLASGSARASVRFVTVTSNPALRALRAMGAPMIPVPMRPMRSGTLLVVALAVRRLGMPVAPGLLAIHEDRARVVLLGDEERVLVGLVHVHGRDEEVVGDVHEAVAALELVGDRLGERVFFERIPYQRARLFDHLEEIDRLETLLVTQQDGGSDVLVALMDLVDEHAARLCL